MILWETPFSDGCPSVTVIPDYSDDCDLALVVRSGSCPRYLVQFKFVPAFRVHEEGMMPASWTFPLPGDSNKCSFIIPESTWVREFKGVSGFIEASYAQPFSNLKHFVIIGGDNVVEVISYEPTIEVVESPRVLKEITV